MHLALRTPLSRRALLRSGAVSLALPLLNAMLPRRAATAETERLGAPKRLLLIGRNLGLHAPFFFPETPGLHYETTPYLQHLEPHRGDFTVFSGLSHLGYNDHKSEPGLFTGVAWDRIKDPSREHRNTVSLDQLAAEHLGRHTRYRNLVLGSPVQWHFSWTQKGLPVPSERSQTETFKQLFLENSHAELQNEIQRLRSGRSILDQIIAESKSLARSLGSEDRERLELMFTSVRETEKNLVRAEAWLHTPKPLVTYRPPDKDPSHDALAERENLWLDLCRLAFQTDSTRVILLTLGDAGRAQLEGLALGHHDASHHGKDEKKIEQLALIESAELQHFGRFLSQTKEIPEPAGTLFQNTAILNASNLGNASAHTCENLPILLAGGGFAHQGHILFDRKNNRPLSNLFVRILQQLNVPTDRFGSSTGAISEV